MGDIIGSTPLDGWGRNYGLGKQLLWERPNYQILVLTTKTGDVELMNDA